MAVETNAASGGTTEVNDTDRIATEAHALIAEAASSNTPAPPVGAGGQPGATAPAQDNVPNDGNGHPPVANQGAATAVPDAHGAVHLAAGTDLSHPQVVGKDLEFVQPDGHVVIIPNGAIQALTVFVGDVAIPPATFASLLQTNGIQPAEGPGGQAGGEGAHGNYVDPTPGGIGPGIGIGNLLPPTALAFGQPQFQQPLANLVTPAPQTPLQILSIDSGNGTVSDADLDKGGSTSGANGEVTHSIITVAAGSSNVTDVRFASDVQGIVIENLNGGTNSVINHEDGSPVQFTVNRIDDHHLEIKADGATVGTVTIDFTASVGAGSTGTVQLTFTLDSAFPHDWGTALSAVIDNIPVVAQDANGFTSSATTQVIVVDDVPAAQADGNAAQSGQSVVGNVESNDTAGADGIAKIGWANATTKGGVTTVTGAHGTLTVGADGSYSYHATANTASGSDSFSYTITDGDGDTSAATLDVTVSNGQPVVTAASNSVDEAGLSTGSTAGTGAVASGALVLTDPDAPQ
ncbi:MAG TPA: Ig-like domain-containing protein, partial [Devosiaceae bacterium]|nr:Ig-like domain-containing protein [Devosiaceae bacterium]